MSVDSTLHLSKEALGKLEHVAEGSQGVVYRTKSLKMDKGSSVFKEYKPQVLRDVNVRVLEQMVEFLFSRSATDGRRLLDSAAWPVRTIRTNHATVGFVMPEIPSAYYFQWKLPSGRVSTQIAQFQYLLNADRVLARGGHVVSDRLRLELLRSVASDLAFLHNLNVAVGDLSPKNLLFQLEPSANTYFVDCDAMTIHGASVLPQLETPDWQAGSAFPGEPIGTIQTDLYKFGLLVLRLIARHQSTASPADLPAWSRGRLADPLKAALSSNPLARPTANAWLLALAELTGDIDDGRVEPTPAPSLEPIANGLPSRSYSNLGGAHRVATHASFAAQPRQFAQPAVGSQQSARKPPTTSGVRTRPSTSPATPPGARTRPRPSARKQRDRRRWLLSASLVLVLALIIGLVAKNAHDGDQRSFDTSSSSASGSQTGQVRHAPRVPRLASTAFVSHLSYQPRRSTITISGDLGDSCPTSFSPDVNTTERITQAYSAHKLTLHIRERFSPSCRAMTPADAYSVSAACMIINPHGSGSYSADPMSKSTSGTGNNIEATESFPAVLPGQYRLSGATACSGTLGTPIGSLSGQNLGDSFNGLNDGMVVYHEAVGRKDVVLSYGAMGEFASPKTTLHTCAVPADDTDAGPRAARVSPGRTIYQEYGSSRSPGGGRDWIRFGTLIIHKPESSIRGDTLEYPCHSTNDSNTLVF